MNEVSAAWMRRFFEVLLPVGPRKAARPAYALLLPHGHPVMTWQVAAPAIGTVSVPDVLVYLSTSHYRREPVALATDVITEAGPMAVPSAWLAGADLVRAGRLQLAREPFLEEHSWRQDLPIWQWLGRRENKMPMVLPILVGDLTVEECLGLMAHLEERALSAWSSITFVASGDFSHVGARYGGRPGSIPPHATRRETLRAVTARDRLMARSLARREVDAYLAQLPESSVCARSHAVAIAKRAPRNGKLHALRAIPFFEGGGKELVTEDWLYVAASLSFPRLPQAKRYEELLESRAAGGAVHLRQRHSGADVVLLGDLAAAWRASGPRPPPPIDRILADHGFESASQTRARHPDASRAAVRRLPSEVAGYAGLPRPQLRGDYRFPDALDRADATRFLRGDARAKLDRGELVERLSSGSSGGPRRRTLATADQLADQDAAAARITRRPVLPVLRLARPSNLLSRDEYLADAWIHEASFGMRAAPGADPVRVDPTRWDRLGRALEDAQLTAVFAEPAYLAAFMLAARERGVSYPGVLDVEVGHGHFWPSLLPLGQAVFPNARWSTLYHSSELGPIGATCPYGALHLVEERRICELAGVPGVRRELRELLVTDVNPAVARPVVRFATGDLVRLGKACRCGALGRAIHVAGRRQDLVDDAITVEQIGAALLADGVGPLFQLEVGDRTATLRTPDDVRSDALGALLRRRVIVRRQLGATHAPAKFRYFARDSA